MRPIKFTTFKGLGSAYGMKVVGLKVSMVIESVMLKDFIY